MLSHIKRWPAIPFSEMNRTKPILLFDIDYIDLKNVTLNPVRPRKEGGLLTWEGGVSYYMMN